MANPRNASADNTAVLLEQVFATAGVGLASSMPTTSCSAPTRGGSARPECRATERSAAASGTALGRGGDPLFVSITLDRRIWLDQVEVRKADLAEAVTSEVARRPGAPVLVKGDRGLDYGTVRGVILELSKTKLPGISLAASLPTDKGGS